MASLLPPLPPHHVPPANAVVIARVGGKPNQAKVFAHRRLAVRGSLGEGREWADDDMSLCSSTRGSSRLSGRDEARSFLSARTALSMSESVEELSKLLSTYHLDNSTRLTQSLCESMSSASLSTLCPTQLSLNADAQSSLSESSWGSQLASLSSLSAKDSMPAGSDLDSRSTSKSIKQHLSSARLRNSSSKAHTPRQASKHHNHPSSMLGPHGARVSSHGGSEVGSSAGALSPPASSFCGTRLHIVGRMRCSETVTAAGDLPFSIVRCRFNWYRFDPAANPGTSDKNLKPVRAAPPRTPLAWTGVRVSHTRRPYTLRCQATDLHVRRPLLFLPLRGTSVAVHMTDAMMRA